MKPASVYNLPKLLSSLLFFSIVAYFPINSSAQCFDDFVVYQYAPAGSLCSPQNATLRAEYYGSDWGELRWYSSETDPTPVQTGYIDPFTYYNDFTVYATNGLTIWVSFYNYMTSCETFRQPYTFNISPAPNVFQEYAYKCNNDPATIQVSSNVSGVTFQLYKLYEYYDPNYGWVQDYQFQQQNTSGYFEISFFDPADIDKYYVKVYQQYGCNNPYYYQIYFENIGPDGPAITGNLSVTQGSSTTLTANGNAFSFKWYDHNNNILHQGGQYTTPLNLLPDMYTYSVVGVSSDGSCTTPPTQVAVTVNYPAVTYTSLYASSNFTKAIDVSKPVGTTSGGPSTTPTGGVTYAIPIYAAPGTNGLLPSISVTYNSQSGNGILGTGWNISGLSVITRSGKNNYHDGIATPVSFTNQDRFNLDGLRLNPITGTNGADGTVYALEAESYNQIISYGSSSDNPSWFKVIAKDGTAMEFGNAPNAKLFTESGQNVILWRLNRIIDINGNFIDFTYTNSFRDSRIDEISYTGNINTGLQPYNKLKFVYETRLDKMDRYEAGTLISSRHLLKSITVIADGSTAKTYQFGYGFDNVTSFLKLVTESGSDGTSLNSTIFLYGNQPDNMIISTMNVLDHQHDYYSGDFNADGKSDLLDITPYIDQTTNTRLHSSYTLHSKLDESSSVLMYTKTLGQNSGSTIIQDKKFFNFLTADYNGDGRDDVLQLNTALETFHCTTPFYRRKVTNGYINYTGSHNDQTSYYDYTPQLISTPSDNLGNQYQFISEKNNFFIPGDFDGDGNRDYILILSKKRQIGTCIIYPKYELDYKAFLSSPYTNESNKEIVNFGFGANPVPEYYAKTIAEADFITTIDFDGDGKTEILITKDYQSYVIRIQRVSATTGYSFSASVVYTTSSIIKDNKVYAGDFNGDRKTDILVRSNSGSWNILYGTGTSFISKAFVFQQTADVTASSNTHGVFISDFNGDGLSDILHAIPVNLNLGYFSLYYSSGAVTGNGFHYQQYTYNNSILVGTMVLGDFNGDGRTDILSSLINEPAELIAFKPFGKERLLSKVMDGYNSTISFEYKNLADKTPGQAVFHERTISLDDPINQGPINYIELPLYAVSAVVTPNGIGGTNTTTFFYKNAVIHKAGKGFLGFREVITHDLTSGKSTLVQNQINTDFALPYTSYQKSYMTASGELLAEQNMYYTIQNLSAGANYKRYFVKQDKTLSVDHLSGAASEITYVYDNYGNISSVTQKVGSLSGTTVTPVETTTTTTVFGLHNTPVPSKPDQITVSKTRSGSPIVTSASTFSYYSNGIPSSKVEFSGLPKAVTTSFVYNAYGNPISITASANSLSNRTTSFVYDTKGRFALEKRLASGTTIQQTETIAYDSKWGQPLSVTSSDCITSTYEYDGFGRLKKQVDPVITVNIYYKWDLQGLNIFYVENDYNGGTPDTKIWYDILGRETKKQALGFQNQWLTINKTYNTKGNLATETNSYYSSETPITTTNTYDPYNRVYTVSNTLNTITYNYEKLSGGNYKITTTDANTQYASKTNDASGKTISSSDKGGELSFNYNSWGAQTEINHGGTTIVTSSYDLYGRQTSLTDKNAGTITYEYDAYGQLKQQTENSRHTYLMNYDELGRIISRVGPEGTTSYEYYKNLVTGCSNNNIKKVIGFNNINKEYSYDLLSRLISESVSIDGTTYTTQYGYNGSGNLNKITYPSGIEVNNIYDNNGQLTGVTGGTPGNQATLFTGISMNGYGRYTSYNLGSRSSQVTYQNGFPTRYYTQGIQDLNLSFDYSKTNLLSRYDAIKGITESFQYDHLNRLTQSTVNGQVQLNMSYDGNTNFSLGNIVSKTDAGSYVYKTDRIHAVAYITNPAGYSAFPITYPNNTQLVTYTPFLKPGTISENNSTLDLTYGPDYNRIKTELRLNNVLSETKYFFGNYEKQIDANGSREIHYIAGGEGLCAIIVKQNGINNIYFVYKDHLGSILTITDVNGNVVAEQNFDPWGRYRDPSNWQYATPSQLPAWVYRGFTGHEHLKHFGLINMNARLYDPIQGRLLSPDNFIPDPNFSQSYNRYSYANNNPLIYYDPDGNNPILVAALVGGILGAYTGGIIANNGQLNPFKWDWSSTQTWTYMVGGALIGAASGALGAYVATATTTTTTAAGVVMTTTMPLANTAGIISSSFVNSMGLNILTGGQVPVGVGFGFGSYNFQDNSVGFLGKKGNSFFSNLAYAFGALANLQDVFAGFNGSIVEVNASGNRIPKENLIPHSYIVDPSTGEVLISVANKISITSKGWFDWVLKAFTLKNKWGAEFWDPANTTNVWSVKLYNVNTRFLNLMKNNIVNGERLLGGGALRWGGFAGCVNQVGRALWNVGIPTIPINLMPGWLNAQLMIRQIGIYGSPFIRQW